MKPLKKAAPKRLPELRVTRKSNIELSHGDGHGWAVSYADLLMVLLSFFVLYFSFSDKSDDEVQNEMQKIALSMQGLSVGEIAERSRKPDSVAAAKLSDILKIDGVKVTQVGDALLLELETGAFKSGGYDIDKKMRAQIDRVVERLEPMKDKLTMTVIGHADNRPMNKRNEFLTDNFDLSSLRALRVMKYVVKQGFPESHLSARAASSYDRDARSITFEIHLSHADKSGGNA